MAGIRHPMHDASIGAGHGDITDDGSVDAALPVRMEIHRRTPYGQWATSIGVVVVFGLLAYSLARNPNLDWASVGEFFLNAKILHGVVVTLELTVLSMVLSIVLAFVVAMMCQSRNRVLAVLGTVYVWFFRGVPLLVQILIWFNLALLFPRILGMDTNTLISGFTAGLLGLAIAESGYMAEIIRGGILSIPRGQADAALSIGLTRGQALRRIILPQSVRVIVPPTGNQFIGLLKGSSLVSAIGGSDLLTQAQLIYGQNFRVVALLIVATIWYLILVTAATLVQQVIERRLDHDNRRGAAGFWRSLGRNIAFSRGNGRNEGAA